MLIGWASADTSPDRPVNLRGQFNVRISEFVKDPVTVTALALESGGEQAIMVSCDRVGIPSVIQQRVAEAVAAQLPDFDATKLVLFATHPHTAPEIVEGFYPPQGPEVMSPTEYADLFVERAADAAVRAWRGRAEGGISWGLGFAVVGRNRRITYADGSSLMYGQTDREDFECVEGYEDHSVGVIFTWDAARRLTGMVVNLACPAQVTESQLFVSADFWHEARVELRRRLGEGLFFLPQCAAAGDQSPHLLFDQRAEAAMRDRRGLTEREEIGRRIANAVADVLETSGDGIDMSPAFKHVVSTLDLPARLVTEEEYKQAVAYLESLQAETPDPADSNAVSYHFVMTVRTKDVIARYERQKSSSTRPVDVHVIRLGDVAIATNPFELFLDYGIRMKARSKALLTLPVQLTGSMVGCEASYLPTARAVAGASYGAQVADAEFGPEAGKALVEGTLEAINGLWGDEGA
jgi:hypothetical protein